MSLASMLFTLAKPAEPPPPEPPLVLYFGALAAACLVGAYITKQAGSASLSIGLGAAFAFSVLEALDLAVVKPNLGVSCFYPGHAPVTVILFAMPAAPAAATAFKVLGGHCAITATSYLLVAMKANLEMLAFASKVLTVGLGVFAMKTADAVHPPAAAFALAFVGGSKDPTFAIGPLIGCAILIACQRVWLELPAPADAGKKKK